MEQEVKELVFFVLVVLQFLFHLHDLPAEVLVLNQDLGPSVGKLGLNDLCLQALILSVRLRLQFLNQFFLLFYDVIFGFEFHL